MVNHILKLRGLQNELHAMENLVSDEDFVMILITSLLESWDNYTGSFLGSSRNKLTITSFELIAVLLDEDQRRKGQSRETSGTALLSKGKGHGQAKTRNVIIAKRRDTSQQTVGLRVVERKVRDQGEEKIGRAHV